MISTVGVRGAQYRVGVQYRGGYLSTVGDIMNTMVDMGILSTMGVIMMHLGIS